MNNCEWWRAPDGSDRAQWELSTSACITVLFLLLIVSCSMKQHLSLWCGCLSTPHFTCSSSCSRFLWVLLCARCVCGQLSTSPTHGSHGWNGTDLVCLPFGTCEPCPDDAVRVLSYFPRCQPQYCPSFTNHFVNRLAIVASCTAYLLPPSRLLANLKLQHHTHTPLPSRPRVRYLPGSPADE